MALESIQGSMEEVLIEILSKAPESIRQTLGESFTTTSTSSEQLRADAYNRTAGALEWGHCDKCRNKGDIAVVRDGELQFIPCDCLTRRGNLRRIEESGLSDLVDRCTFDTFGTEKKWQQVIKAKALEFCRTGGGEWLVVAGRSGSGKTHICTAVAGELMKQGKCLRYVRWRVIAPRLKSVVMDAEKYAGLIDPLKRVEVLYIDDFLKGNITSSDLNLAFELIDARYADKRLVTILSSEMSIEKIAELDEALAGRIYERGKGYCLATQPENWRFTQA